MSEREVSSFWDHLDVLRKVLFRCLIAWAIGATVAFCFKSILFNLLFAPSTDTFISYRGLAWLCEKTGWQSLCPGNFKASFINTELAAQFMTHIKVALGAGLVVVSPYLIVQLYGFVAPALYDREKRHAAPIIIWGTLLFVLGVLMNYFIIFPFAFRFLNSYQVYAEVHNQISLSSYISKCSAYSWVSFSRFPSSTTCSPKQGFCRLTHSRNTVVTPLWASPSWPLSSLLQAMP